MVEESGQAEKLPEAEAPGAGSGETANLERLLAEKDGEVAKANARLSELERVVADKEAEITSLKETGQEMEKRLTNLNSSLADAVASYKTVVLRANPEVIEELISGDTIEAIKESLSRARELVSKVRQGVENEISLAKVPAGAPERTSPDLSTLSPREKIQYAIGRK